MALKDLTVKMRLDNSQFKAGMKDSVKELDNMARSASSMSGMLQMAGVAGFAFLGKQALGAAWDLGEFGAQALRTETALGQLAAQAGGSADAIVAAIRRASMGTISDMEIMAAANRGILLGLGADAEQWAQLTEVAAYRARAMGLTTAQALSDITTGIGRESRMILDNLGIILDVDQVTANYAATLGKTAEQLSAAERKQAILNSVIEEGQGQIAAAGGMALDAAGKIEEMNASLANLKQAMAEQAAPATAELASELTHIIEVVPNTANQLVTLIEAGLMWAAAAMTGADATAAFARHLTAIQDAKDLAQEAGRLGRSFGVVAVEAGDAVKPVKDLGLAYQFLYDNIAAKAAARITGEDVWSFGDPYELESGMTGALDAIAEQEEENASRSEELAEQYARAWDKAYDTQEDRLRDLRSTIESALSPTSVTALDMFQTGQGTYTDKWDEAARRASAIASGGFGELQAHPDWAAALKIPPEILTANEDVLKEWATNTADQVRNLMRPDLLNVDAAVAAVKQSMQDAAAKELSIDLIANAMIAEGSLNPEDAKRQVAQALGLDQTLAGENMGQQMMDGLKASMESSNPAAQFAGYVQKNIEANTALLRTTGENLWHVINIGIDVAMKHTEYAKKLASIIAPEVAQILQERGVWGGTIP